MGYWRFIQFFWLASLFFMGHNFVLVHKNEKKKELGQYKQTLSAKLQVHFFQVYIEELKEEFDKEFIFPAVKANAIYEDRYLMGTGTCNTVFSVN